MIKKLELPENDTKERGLLYVVEDWQLFKIRRVFFIKNFSPLARRGGHAHRRLWQFIISTAGEAVIASVGPGMKRQRRKLRGPYEGILVPPGHWLDITMQSGGDLLVLASDVYKKSDYIYDFEEFKKLFGGKA